MALLCSGALALDSQLILPGQGVGPIRQGMTRQSLDQLGLDERDLEDSNSALPGTSSILPSTEVFDNQPERHLTVIWADSGRDRMQSIIVAAPHSVWHTVEGLKVGTTLLELEALNGRPFRFQGFGSDQGGTVTDWMGGRLENLRGLVTVSLLPDWTTLSAEQKTALAFPREVESGAPLAHKLNPPVGQLLVELAAPAGGIPIEREKRRW